MLKNTRVGILLLLSVCTLKGLCQETMIFKISDFDLIGEVKNCSVSTDYGKEEYKFNKEGWLIESVTRFSDTDYDITRYNYQKGELLQKRLEQYRGKTLQKSTSIANFYTRDTIGNFKVTEKIVTYEKEFIEQNEYSYTANKQLIKVIRTTNDVIDETSVVYLRDGDTSTAEYFLNSELQKSIRTTVSMQGDTLPIRTITTKTFFEGQPNTATTITLNSDGKISTETHLSYDITLKKFVPSLEVVYFFGHMGEVEKTITNTDGNTETKEYIYQFDPIGNWVKQIVTPDNTYKSRKIEYYAAPDSLKAKG